MELASDHLFERANRWGRPVAYAGAVAAVAAATLLRLAADPLLGTRHPFTMVYVAIAVTARFGGVGPAALAALLGYGVADFLFLGAREHSALFEPTLADVVGAALYLTLAAAIVFPIEVWRRAERRTMRTILQLHANRAEIARRERRFRSLADAAPTVLAVTEVDGRCTFLSRGWYDFTGQPPDAGLGFGWLDAVHPDDRALVRATLFGDTGRGPRRVDGRLRHADGGWRWVEGTVQPRFTAEGACIGFVGALVDVTDRKAVEEALRERDRNLQALLHETQAVTDLMAAAVARCTRDRRYRWASRQYATWLGRPLEDVVGRSFTEVLGEAACQRLEPCFARALSGERVEHEEELELHGLGRRWISAAYVPTRDDAGQVDGWVEVIVDITRRKELELAIDRARTATETHLREATALMAIGRELSQSLDLEAIIAMVCRMARELVGADGVAFVMREGTEVHYVAENAIEPLWKGRRFPIGECIAGWTLLERRTAVVDDVDQDDRIPLAAYRTTFVRSLVMAPVRRTDPLGALGAYWSRPRTPSPDEVRALESVADLASIALQNARLFEEVQEANRAKDEFLAMLSHELRNPLAPIRNAVEVLKTLGPAPTPLQRARDIIARQVTHMTHLVDDLLEVSRITQGKITLHRRCVRLDEVIDQAVEAARPLLEQHGHTLAVVQAPEPVHVDADPARLVQVVGNLLANAAKFTPRGGHVTVESAIAANGRAAIRVRDTGIGVPKAAQARIFRLFAQEDRSLARSQGGLGIGLTIVQRLVELHGGLVTVDSEGHGRGATFTVELPRTAAPTDQRPAAGPGATAPAPVPSIADRPLAILVVEDNVDTADSFTMLLELEGHVVRVAHRAVEALRLLDDFLPDVAFVDLGLPDLTGFELAKRMRADSRTRHTLLVAVTGYGREEDRAAARQAGFDRHLTKPVEMAAVTELLVGLGGARVHREQQSHLVH